MLACPPVTAFSGRMRWSHPLCLPPQAQVVCRMTARKGSQEHGLRASVDCLPSATGPGAGGASWPGSLWVAWWPVPASGLETGFLCLVELGVGL